MFKYIVLSVALVGAVLSLQCDTCGQIYYSKSENAFLKNLNEIMDEGMALCSSPVKATCNESFAEDGCIDYTFTVR